MLGKLFKPGWQSDAPEKRLAAIAGMDSADSENQSVFEALVNGDPSAEVRYAALAKLTTPSIVFQFCESHPDQKTKDSASQALANLLGPKSSLTESDFRTLLAQQPQMREAILSACPHAEFREELIQSLPETQQAELVASVEYSETRQAIANRLSQQSDLELARKQLRGRDKSAEKIVKAKLDVIHAEQRLAEEQYQATLTICEKMEHFATHEWRPDFRSKHQIWSQRWDELDFDINAELKARYDAANEVVSANSNRDLAIEQAGIQQAKQAQNLKSYCEKISGLSLQQLIESRSAHLACLSVALEAWKKANDVSTPLAKVTDQFLQGERALMSASHFCNELAEIELFSDSGETAKALLEQETQVRKLKSALQELQWPKHYQQLTGKTEAEELLADAQQQLGQDKQSYSDKLDKLHKRINRLLGATSRGDLGQANRELAAVSKAVDKYTGRDKAALDERLLKATEAVGKMGDWKDFATEPKFLELCEKMESLETSKKHPDNLSIEIAELQKSWKALGYSEIADQHWPRFKASGDRAYEPCSTFFKQRRATRKQNLQDREPIVEQMRSLLEGTDWEGSVDYKSVENQLQRISQAWQKIKDVERADGQKQWDRLSELRAGVYEKLDVVYDANIELKNKLIEQVASLLETDIKEETLSKLQLYQSKWKQVGVTRRKQDQAAWKNFKKTSDAVFDKIKGLRNAKRAEEDEKIQGYRGISKQIHQLAKSATELAQADPEFERLLAEYKELPPLPHALPEKMIKGLEGDFQKAQSAYDQARVRIQAKAKDQVIEALKQKAELCSELEALGPNGDSDKVAELKASLDAVVVDNKELNKRFEQRLKAISDNDRSAASEQRRLLCIDLEILLDRPSPAEDSAQRMQIQLERMKTKGIGQAQHDQAAHIEDLKIEWLCLPGAEPKIQKELDVRFEKLLAK